MTGLKRKAYSKLLEWKNSRNGSSALLIDGARRVGKSYLVEEFGRNEYRSHILIDFNNVPDEIKYVFNSRSYDLDNLFFNLSVFYGVTLYERDSLIIFDEVQCFPRARALIKYLVKDGRYDYIETGSLISIKTNIKDIVIPSEEEHFKLDPLDFEEFLWAMGDDTAMPYIIEKFNKLEPLGEAIHRKIMDLFREYMMVGGMPQAVVAYAENRNLADLDRIKRGILDLYRNDISRFAAGYEMKVVSIFDMLPSQLSKREKRFVLSSLGGEPRMRSYENAFLWLDDGRIINRCVNATEPTFGLFMNVDTTTQKCYMADTGLLVSHALRMGTCDESIYKALLFDRLGLNEGMFAENIVAQMLHANGHDLFFYSRNSVDKDGRMEIDFLIRRGRKICPVEVKSSSYTKHSSLDKFMRKFGEQTGQAYILYQNDVMVKDGIAHIPLYMAMLL